MALNKLNSQLIEPAILSGSKSSWSIINSNYNAQPYENLKVNTTSGIVNVTLPNNPPDDTKIYFSDYNDTFAINKLTIKPYGGQKIMSLFEDMDVNNKGIYFALVYKANTQDWRIEGLG
jgi:hypothetical protein